MFQVLLISDRGIGVHVASTFSRACRNRMLGLLGYKAGVVRLVRSGRLPQHDAVRDFADGDHAPERDE